MSRKVSDNHYIHGNHFLVLTSTLFFAVLVTFSCAPLYIPNNANTPLLSQKGEGTLAVNYGFSGLNLHSAYAPANHIGVMLNGSYLNTRDQSDRHGDDYLRKQRFCEIAVGYFKEIDENAVTEIYLGAGLGKSASKDNYLPFSSTEVHAEGNYYRLFVQPNLGMKYKILEMGAGLRACYVNFTKIEYENYELTGSGSDYFFEPVFFVGLGGPVVKFQAQLGLSMKAKEEDVATYEPLILGFGISARIGAK